MPGTPSRSANATQQRFIKLAFQNKGTGALVGLGLGGSTIFTNRDLVKNKGKHDISILKRFILTACVVFRYDKFALTVSVETYKKSFLN